MENKKIICTSCSNKFEWKHSHTNLWFKKYECPKCKQNFVIELTTWYKVFYWLLLLVLLWTWISSIIDWWFPVVRWIFTIFIGSILFKDFSNKKSGWKSIKKTGKKGFIIVGIIAALIALSFIMQWDPVKFNEEQKIYIWNWQWEGIELIIGDGAYIHYKKEKDNMSTSVSGPMTEINDNEFKVGIWFINTTFIIDKKPYQDWNLWKMIVDWNELSRITNRFELQVPELWELNKLTNEFLTLFKNSIYIDDYQAFYDWIATTWKSQTNVDELKNGLSWFSVNEIDFYKIMANEIIYSKPPFLDENNLLILEWYYAGDMKLSFNLKFIYEYPNWKLIWFNF